PLGRLGGGSAALGAGGAGAGVRGALATRRSSGAGGAGRGAAGAGAGGLGLATGGLGGLGGAGRLGGAGGAGGADGRPAEAGSCSFGSSTISESPFFTSQRERGKIFPPHSIMATTARWRTIDAVTPTVTRLGRHCRRNSQSPIHSDYKSRSTAWATFRTRAISAANRSGFSDWGPSESASSGLGCTSISKPSAPAATAAIAIDSTYSQCPVPWLGSTTTGRCVSFLSTGTALRSSVKRVAVSKVRMPRSHRITLGLPPASTYSADSSHSWMLVDIPR